MESERMRALEAAFERERQQRDLLEKKYARLKRRYIRLERSHARLVMESHGPKLIHRITGHVASKNTQH
ncbi:hypothetical protein JM16_007587 [Phytophthora kernoviae]|uniref:Uncharacterized protein n=1 Tax=Phytophthora kernoviae TaxID=325452 RepID=A0A8T0LRW7_9STRA|nr:hypothetical protein JM16_007587 [Phytophthora kernoviae]